MTQLTSSDKERIVLKITKEDIRNSVVDSDYSNPIVLAFRRQFKRDCKISMKHIVDGFKVWITNTDKLRRFVNNLSPSRKKYLRPTTIELVNFYTASDKIRNNYFRKNVTLEG